MRNNLLVFVVSMTCILVLSEFVVRSFGWVPGQMHYNQWFNPVDTLIELKGFKVDEHGMFKVDTAVVAPLMDELKQSEISYKKVGKYAVVNDISYEIAALAMDHILAVNDDSVRSTLPFTEEVYSPCFDTILRRYLKSPINADGFYSIPFENPCQQRPVVMMIGDSFLWGHTATNNLLSFSNLLLAKHYLIYNFGVSGADVSQYQQILNSYLERLNPDVVIVNFFMGNDLCFDLREPKPNCPIFHSTNSGNLYSFRNGLEFSNMWSAYEYVMSKTFVPKDTWIGRLVNYSALGTLVWKACTQYDDWWKYYHDRKWSHEVPVSTKQLKQMNRFCDSVSTPMVVSVIPELKNGRIEKPDLNKFDNLDVNCPLLELDDYNLSDGHFNNQGHQTYADFLDSLITQTVLTYGRKIH